jgi:hypothetical protein
MREQHVIWGKEWIGAHAARGLVLNYLYSYTLLTLLQRTSTLLSVTATLLQSGLVSTSLQDQQLAKFWSTGPRPSL